MRKIIFSILLVIGLFFVSWGATCLLIKFITWCFGWNFNLLYATGIFVIICLINGFINQLKK